MTADTNPDPLDPDLIAQMDQEYRAGKSLRDLAREHDLHHTRVRRALLAYGTPMRLPGFLNSSRDDKILKLHAKGYSLAQIGEVLNISRQRVHQVVHRKKDQT